MGLLKIAFLMSGIGISGGTNVIFEHAMQLRDRGYSITIVVDSLQKLRAERWHRIFDLAEDYIDWAELGGLGNRKFDIAVATYWMTIFQLGRIHAEKYVYFVQSIESRFYPARNQVLRSLVEATYEQEFGFITEAKWIRSYLQTVRGCDVELAPNGIRKTSFCEDGPVVSPRDPDNIRILIEGPLGVPFKNVEDSIRICGEFARSEIWLLTSSPISFYNGVDRIFSQVPIGDVAAIYRSCDVLLKLSFVEGMFGPPLEMYHCGGTSIAYDVTGYDEYMVSGKNCLVAPSGDRSAVGSAIRALERNPDLLTNLKSGALLTASSWPSWDVAGQIFEKALLRAAEHCSVKQYAVETYGRRLHHIFRSFMRESAGMGP